MAHLTEPSFAVGYRFGKDKIAIFEEYFTDPAKAYEKADHLNRSPAGREPGVTYKVFRVSFTEEPRVTEVQAEAAVQS